MKSNIRILSILLALSVSSVLFTKQVSAQQSYVSFQLFYDQLSPYGDWVEYPNYGYVWIPNAGYDFVPYSTRGHWILSEYGWTWVSDYRWGWAPFHYGRWDYDNYYGWFWIPDNEWGPAWVSWRRADGYYGWSPMGPGMSISVSFGRGYDRQNDHWMFVRDRDIDRSNITSYYVNRADHDRIIRNSSVITNTYVDNNRNTTYVTGPEREDFQRATGRKVNSVTIEEYNMPGQQMKNGRLRIYKPQVKNDNNGENRSAPARIVNLRDVNRPAERNVTNQSRTNPRSINRQETRPNPVNQQNNSNNTNSGQGTEVRTVNPDRRDTQSNPVIQVNRNSEKTIQRQNTDQNRNDTRVQKENATKPLKEIRNERPKKNNFILKMLMNTVL
jgi:hypothetical protein